MKTQNQTHTPGPLTVTRETERHIETIRDERGRWLADVVAGQGSLLAAAPELAKALQALAKLRIERCPRCDGTGAKERESINEACGYCGGTGEDTGNPHPDDIRAAQAALKKAGVAQ